jgi:hypothetical protein
MRRWIVVINVGTKGIPLLNISRTSGGGGVGGSMMFIEEKRTGSFSTVRISSWRVTTHMFSIGLKKTGVSRRACA